jgi:hypothetical protein
MNAKYEFSEVQSRINHLLLRTPRDQQTKAWEALYYAQPNTSEAQVAGYRRKFDAYHQEGIGEYLTSIEGLVNEMARLAEIVLAEKSAPKVKRQVVSDSGHYNYPTEPSFKIAGPHDIFPGDYLLVRYGNGTQLVFVKGSLQGRKTLKIRRLFSRGTRWVGWRDSTISREDKRILGRSSRVSQDPLP